MTSPLVTLSELSDEAPGKFQFSPRLDAVIDYLPKYAGCRVRVANALCNASVFTLTALCQHKRGELRRWKNFGKKSLDDLEATLARFGLALADTEKPVVVPDQGCPARIQLSLQRPDGHRSEITSTLNVTPVMLEAAEDLLETLTTGQRPPPKGLYELCATAFGMPRDETKKRLIAAMYGMGKEAFDVRKQGS